MSKLKDNTSHSLGAKHVANAAADAALVAADVVHTSADSTHTSGISGLTSTVGGHTTTIATHKSTVNSIRTALLIMGGDEIVTQPTLGIGGTKTKVSHGAFDFIINGLGYKKAANADGVVLTVGTVPQNKYAVYRLQIGSDGTVDVVPSADHTTGYDTAQLALAAVPAVAANHAVLGWVSVMSSDVGGFVAGTSNLDDAPVTEVYTDDDAVFAKVIAALPSAIA